jgi:hypothetical protein
LGITKINGSSVAVYDFRNGAKLGDVAGPGLRRRLRQADHLLRRFAFRKNLN